jgi:hypothetical protein
LLFQDRVGFRLILPRFSLNPKPYPLGGNIGFLGAKLTKKLKKIICSTLLKENTL